MEQKIQEIHQLVSELRKRYEEFEKKKFTKAEFEEFEQKINARIDELETMIQRPQMSAEEGKKDEPSIEVKAFWNWVRKGELSPEEQKVMKISDDTSGGYVAPIEFSRRIIEKLTEISPIRQIVTVETIGGSGIEFPKETEDTVTAAWPDEELVAGDYQFGMEKLEPHELRVLVTPKKTLLEDSFFDIEAYIIRKTTEKFAKKEGPAFISGSGNSKPEGFLTNADIQEVVSGDAANVTSDSLINICYSIPSYYARNARWLMKRSTVGKIRLLKDNNGQYMWQPSLQAGQPSMLLGYPITEAVDMPDVAANSYPIMFGNFRAAYLIVDRINIEVQRLVELYATQGLVGFLFRKRVDAQVILPEAVRKLKIAA